ncbi:MAG: HAD hydrolase-like protein, partial [Erysipelotrichaceae bacterium]|nr:HAD hydrolase-like protein [Erysipelotrichaceae bacterium]
YFSYLLGTDNLYGGSKIDMAIAFMQKQKIDPTNCRFIGDTLHDQECANAIGINDVVLVAQGHQSRSVLESGCDHVADSLMEVEL